MGSKPSGYWNLMLLPFPLSFNKLLYHGLSLIVGTLDERVFHRIGRDGQERTADPSFSSDLAATDGINGHPATVGGILNGKP